MDSTYTFPVGALQLLSDGNSGDTAGAAARQTTGEESAADAAGGQAPAAGVQEGSEEAFEELIRGPYKKVFDERMQRTISRRLKQSRQELEKFQTMAPVLDRLAQKFGVDAADTDALLRALEEDAPQIPEEETDRRASALAENWLRQEQLLRQAVPGFDLKRELSDSRFRQLLSQGVCLADAYGLCHSREFLTEAMAFAVDATTRCLAGHLAARGQRPRENGMGGTCAVVSRREVARFSGSDIDQIRRRVEKGERISFG